jgi:hypothetical protein
MWLIATYRLVLYGFVEPPPYAILSHRWGHEVVTFEMMQRLNENGLKVNPTFSSICERDSSRTQLVVSRSSMHANKLDRICSSGSGSIRVALTRRAVQSLAKQSTPRTGGTKSQGSAMSSYRTRLGQRATLSSEAGLFKGS